MSFFSFFRRKKKRPRIDPFTLTDPWRSFVQDALQAQARFARIVDEVEEGPLDDRLGELEDRVGEGVVACWTIAQSGHNLQKMLREVSGTPSDSVTRMRARRDEVADKLAALTKNLDESAARAAELATGQLEGLNAVADEVDNVVSELEALRQALAEISPA